MVQLSISADKPLDYHLELGAKLAPLRERGVLVIASGNVVHNVRGMDWHLLDGGYDWAKRFNEDAKALLQSDPADAARLDGHSDFRLAVPTPDHFIPLLYIAGLAGVAAGHLDVLVDGYTYGTMSMTAYTLGLVAAVPGAVQFDSAPPVPIFPPTPQTFDRLTSVRRATRLAFVPAGRDEARSGRAHSGTTAMIRRWHGYLSTATALTVTVALWGSPPIADSQPVTAAAPAT